MKTNKPKNTQRWIDLEYKKIENHSVIAALVKELMFEFEDRKDFKTKSVTHRKHKWTMVSKIQILNPTILNNDIVMDTLKRLVSDSDFEYIQTL